jgi:hypothetical protein
VTRTVLLGAVAALAAAATASTCLVACGSSSCDETLTCATGDDATTDVPGGDDGPPAADTYADRPDPDRTETSDASSDAPDALDSGDGNTQDAPADAVEGSLEGSTTGCAAAGFTCTPAVPPGFHGPVAIIETQSDAGATTAPASCGSPYPADLVDGYDVPVYSPPSCQCQCGFDAGCSQPVVQTYKDNTCVNACSQLPVGACTLLSCGGSASQGAVITTASQASGTSCAESVRKTTIPWDPTQDWGVAGRVCGAAPAADAGSDASSDAGSDAGSEAGADAGNDAGCPGTDLCTPAPSSPFAPTLCVWIAGDVPCPMTSYTRRTRLFTTGTDSRDCLDGCSCGAPTGVGCSETITASSSSSCAGGTLLATTCKTYPGTTTPYISATVTGSGSCTPSGSATPMGMVTPKNPVTICCQ